MARRSLSGRTVVITGGAGGIGQACVERLLEDEARVAVLDPSEAGLHALRQRFSDRSKVLAVASALESPDACAAALEPIEGPIHALVHLAGILEADRLDAADRPVWDRMIAANLTTAFDMVTACHARFSPTNVARIIFATSVAYRRGSVDHLGYTAAKGGITGLVRALSRQLAPAVLVNAVAPGIIKTTMTQPLIAERADRLMAEIPLRRWGESSEVASVVAFLCSDEASYITGQVINIDGGMVNS